VRLYEPRRGQEQMEWVAAASLRSQEGFAREALLGDFAGSDDEQGWKAGVIARCGTALAVVVVGCELGRVLASALSSTVVLEEEAEAVLSTPVAAVAIRSATPARTSRCTAPLFKCVITAAQGYASSTDRKHDEDRISADRMLQIPQ